MARPQQPQQIRPLGPAGDAGPAGPDWQGRYFEGSGGRSWQRFDITRYADVKLLPIPQIRANQLHQQFFGELKMAIDPERAARVLEHAEGGQSLTDEDRAFERYAQYEFSRIVQKFAPAERTLTDETMRAIFAKNPGLEQVMEMNGVPGTAKAARDLMMHLAVRRQGGADAFLEAHAVLLERGATGRAKRSEEKIKGICKSAGIERERYEQLIVPGDRRATEANFDAFFKQRESGYRTWLDPIKASWLARRAMRASPEEVRLHRPRSWVTADIHEARRAMAEFFNLGITDETSDTAKEFRRRMERYAVTGALERDPAEAGPRSYAEAQAAADIPLSELQSYFDRDKAAYAARRGAAWSDLPDDIRESFAESWTPAELAETRARRGLGFFSLIARAIARLLLGEKKKQLNKN